MTRKCYSLLTVFVLTFICSCRTLYFDKYIITKKVAHTKLISNSDTVTLSFDTQKFNESNYGVYVIEDMVSCIDINDSVSGGTTVGGNVPPTRISQAYINGEGNIRILKNEILNLFNRKCKELKDGFLQLLIGNKLSNDKVRLYRISSSFFFKDGTLKIE